MEFTSQVGQDKWVCEYFNYKRGGFFLDIGAYDGILLSNTYYLEKELGWYGICVEPSPTTFPSLKQNRGCICVNKAAYSYDGDVMFGDVGFIGGVSSSGNIPTKSITIETLLSDMGCPDVIDYVSLDVEGAEYDVLLKFPFDKHEVVLWTIEHNSYIDGGVLKEKVKGIMKGRGYSIHTEDLECGGLKFEDWYINNKYYGVLCKDSLLETVSKK